MKEEDNILRKVGTQNPFKVPEGYFDRLTSEVMERLPEKKAPAFELKEPGIWDKVKPWLYMAAMFVGAALIIRVASPQKEFDNESHLMAEENEREEQYISTVLDNSMLDDYSLYVYLTGNEIE